jgi:hypothetical protein
MNPEQQVGIRNRSEAGAEERQRSAGAVVKRRVNGRGSPGAAAADEVSGPRGGDAAPDVA